MSALDIPMPGAWFPGGRRPVPVAAARRNLPGLPAITVEAVDERHGLDVTMTAHRGYPMLGPAVTATSISPVDELPEADVRKAVIALIAAYTSRHGRPPPRAVVSDIWAMLQGEVRPEIFRRGVAPGTGGTPNVIWDVVEGIGELVEGLWARLRRLLTGQVR